MDSLVEERGVVSVERGSARGRQKRWLGALFRAVDAGSTVLSYVEFLLHMKDIIKDSTAAKKNQDGFKQVLDSLKENYDAIRSIPSEYISQTLGHNYNVTKMNNRVIHNIEEVVTGNYIMLKMVKEEIHSILEEVSNMRMEMAEGFKSILEATRISRIEPTLSKLNGIITAFERLQDGMKNLPLTEHVAKLEEQDGIINILKDSTTPKGDSLHTVLYDIIHQNYAIPQAANDEVGFKTLEALYYGTLTYIAIMIFLIEEFSFLTDYYYNNIELDKYNKFFSLIQTTFHDFKHSLVGSGKGFLINDVIDVLITVKKKYSEEDTSIFLFKRIDSLQSIKQQILRKNLALIEDVPLKLKGKPFEFDDRKISTPIGEWKEGVRVRYAVQFREGDRYSRVGEWSEAVVVGGSGCPVVRVPVDPLRRTRLVFRRFGEERPELAAVLEGVYLTSFRDIHRDLYNAAGSSAESARREVEALLARGADPGVRFAAGRQAIHSAAAAGNLPAAAAVLAARPAAVHATDRAGYTPLHVAAENGAHRFVQFLVEREANTNVRTKSKSLTPLHLSALHGYLPVVKTLLANNLTDVNAREKEGFTPFHAAVFGGNLVVEAFMADNRTKINAFSEEYLTPLHLACISDYLDIAKTLFKSDEISINARASGNFTALHFAAMAGSVKLVKFLLSKNKINLNPKSINNWTPLHFAIAVKSNEVPLELIKNNETDINIAGEWNVMPLHLAAISGQKTVVVALLERGTDINQPTKDGLTALHFAAIHGHLDVVACLCDYNANIEAKTIYGWTPFLSAVHSKTSAHDVILYLQIKRAKESAYHDGPHLAAKNGYLNLVRILTKDEKTLRWENALGESILHSAVLSENTDLVDYLLERKLKLNSTNKKGETPLFYAAAKGVAKMYEHLIRKGAELYPKDKSAVHAAAIGGNSNMVKYLVENKHFDPNSKTSEAETPLHFAAQSGMLDLVEYLVEEKGSDIKAKTNKNKTPLDYAVAAAKLNVVRYLIHKGGDFPDKGAKYINTFLNAAENGDVALVKYLAEEKGVPLAGDLSTEFPLHLAAKSGHLDLFRYLLDKGYGDVDSKTPQGETPLHFAAQSGKVMIVEYLVQEKSTPINVETAEGKTPLDYAAERGNIDVVKYFVSKGTDFHDKYSNYRETLLNASASGNLVLVKYLVEEKGALPQSNKIDSEQPLHAAAKNGHLAIVKYLLEKKGVDIDPVEGKGEIPLFYAAKSGHLNVVQYLLEKGADLNHKSKEGKTVQHYACGSGKVDLVKYLDQRGASLSSRSVYSETPIYYAAMGGHLELVKYLTEHRHEDVFDKTSGYLTLLHYAAQGGELSLLLYLEDKGLNIGYTPVAISPLFFGVNSGKIDVVKYLVEKGADINDKGWNYSKILKANYSDEFKAFFPLTPLHLAAKGGHLDIVTYLVENGVDVNSQNTMKLTPLHYAAKNGKLNVVKYLLEKGAYISAVDIVGKVPLHLAAGNGMFDVVKYLVEKGADVNSKDQEEDTPLHFSATSGKLDVVRYLIEKDANPNSKTKTNATPLHEAAGKGKLHVVKYLLEKGANVNVFNNLQLTPLHEAAASETDRLDVVECLVEKGANYNLQDTKMRTPLHYAAKAGNADIVKYLVEKGADVNIRDVQEYTPLFDAVDDAHFDITKYLVEHGAQINITDYIGETPLHHAAKLGNRDIVKYFLELGADRTVKDNEGKTPADKAGHSVSDLFTPLIVRRKRSGVRATSVTRSKVYQVQSSSSQINGSSTEVSSTLAHFKEAGTYPELERHSLQDYSAGSEENNLRSVQSSAEGTSTFLLLLNLLRTKIMQKHFVNYSREISDSEATGQTLNITALFEAAVREAATETNISFRALNINFLKALKEIKKKIIEGKYDDVISLLKSEAKKGLAEIDEESNLNSHEKSKFMAALGRRLDFKLHQHLQKYMKHRS